MALCAACQVVCVLVTLRYLQRKQHPTVLYAVLKLRGAIGQDRASTPEVGAGSQSALA
jgi:hypothetical protein